MVRRYKSTFYTPTAAHIARVKMLPSKLVSSGITLLAALMSACAWSSGPCAFPEYADRIERSKRFVQESSPLSKNFGVLMGSVQRICAVLEFEISHEGKAENIELVASWPDEGLRRTAFKTLYNYQFIVPSDSEGGDKFYLYFEESRERREDL